MKKINLVLLLLIIGLNTFAEDHRRPDGFDFSNPSTMKGKISLSYRGLKKFYNKKDLNYEKELRIFPTSFEIFEDNEDNSIKISFSSVSAGGGSSYTRDFIYDSEANEYVFFIYNYGGGWQKMKFVYENNMINCYLKEGSMIWNKEDDWIFISDVIYLLDNYVP